MNIAVRENRAFALDPRTVQCQHPRLQEALQFHSLPSSGGWEKCPLVPAASPQAAPALGSRLAKLVGLTLVTLFNRF